MWSSRRDLTAATLVGALLLAGIASANPIIIGAGGEVDTADSRAVSLFTDIGLTDDTWISGSFAWTHTDREIFDLATKYADVGIDHNFRPVGFRLSAAYWGDDGLLESNDIRGSLYLRGEKGSISVDLERRAFDLTIGGSLLVDPLTFEFDADGIGLTGSLPINDQLTLYASGMDYDYSEDIRLQPDIDVVTLRFFSRSRLSMINSLIDYRASIGIDLAFDLRRLDLRVARWRTEVDQGEVNSYSLGFLTPASRSADIEFRLAYDDSENFGGATVFSVFFYLFDE